jgi:hypothetical protein
MVIPATPAGDTPALAVQRSAAAQADATAFPRTRERRDPLSRKPRA